MKQCLVKKQSYVIARNPRGVTMPKGTRVEKLYQKLRAQGRTEESAARISQAVTGLSLATGKKPKGTRRSGTGMNG
jgi:hypothetical protein